MNQLDQVKQLMEDYRNTFNKKDEIEIARKFMRKHSVFLTEQAERALHNARELEVMDLQLFSEQKKIRKLEKEIKRYRRELKDIRDISTRSVHDFAKNALKED